MSHPLSSTMRWNLVLKTDRVGFLLSHHLLVTKPPSDFSKPLSVA